jgi:hypothetical protein
VNAGREFERFYAYLAQFDSKRSAEHVFHTLIEAKDRLGTPSESLACGAPLFALVALTLGWGTADSSALSTKPTTALELTSAACTAGTRNPAATNAIKHLNPTHHVVLINAISCLLPLASRTQRSAVPLRTEVAPRPNSYGKLLALDQDR